VQKLPLLRTLRQRRRDVRRLQTMNKATLAILAALSASIALADDFKTIDGKEYKDVTVTRIEPDGIVLKGNAGIWKILLVELPKDVQERFHYDPAAAKAFTAQQQQAQAAAKASNDAAARQQQAEASTKAAADAALAEKNRRFKEKIAQLHGNLVNLQGKVLQVLKNGILVTDAHFLVWEFTADGELDPVRTGKKDRIPFNDVVYLEANPNKFYDGDSVDEPAFEYGSFVYVTPAGIQKKIRAFTLSLDHGVEYARRHQ
jgi:hypothetical protein